MGAGGSEREDQTCREVLCPTSMFDMGVSVCYLLKGCSKGSCIVFLGEVTVQFSTSLGQLCSHLKSRGKQAFSVVV